MADISLYRNSMPHLTSEQLMLLIQKKLGSQFSPCFVFVVLVFWFKPEIHERATKNLCSIIQWLSLKAFSLFFGELDFYHLLGLTCAVSTINYWFFAYLCRDWIVTFSIGVFFFVSLLQLFWNYRWCVWSTLTCDPFLKVQILLPLNTYIKALHLKQF